MLGHGRDVVQVCAADAIGRVDLSSLDGQLADLGEPKLIIGNAGEVNAGDFDPIATWPDIAERRGAWLHLDASFGLFAALSREPLIWCAASNAHSRSQRRANGSMCRMRAVSRWSPRRNGWAAPSACLGRRTAGARQPWCRVRLIRPRVIAPSARRQSGRHCGRTAATGTGPWWSDTLISPSGWPV